jgi:hypothetical protein
MQTASHLEMSKNRSHVTPERPAWIMTDHDAAMKLCCPNAADVTARDQHRGQPRRITPDCF